MASASVSRKWKSSICLTRWGYPFVLLHLKTEEDVIGGRREEKGKRGRKRKGRGKQKKDREVREAIREDRRGRKGKRQRQKQTQRDWQKGFKQIVWINYPACLTKMTCGMVLKPTGKTLLFIGASEKLKPW